jgi:hypothetical protein
MEPRVITRFRRRVARGTPPPYWKRAVLFVSALTLGFVLAFLASGSGFAGALLGALILGLPAGLILALVLPIRIRRRP